MTSKVHQPISKDEFRVLRVSQIEPTIVCDLIHRSVYQPPEYFAISYAWGTEPASRTISCNGEDFQVTDHLYHCITSLCNIYGFQDIWIDAICINQNNDAEKAEQVSFMGDIYKQATKVYIWLGTAENNSDALFDFVQAHAETLFAKPVSQVIRSQLKDSEGYVLKYLTKPLAEVTVAICKRSWFHRLWTVQEITLARQVDFICGLKTLDQSLLCGFVISLMEGQFKVWILVSFGIKILDEFDRFAEIVPIFKSKARSGVDRIGTLRVSAFASYIQMCRKRKVKLPLDRIYGLLGLCDKNDPYYIGLSTDYSAANISQFWKLYIQFGKLCLLHEPCLYLLATPGSRHRIAGLPSWCPNFDSQPQQFKRLFNYSSGWPSKTHCQTEQCGTRHPSFHQPQDYYVRTSDASDGIEIQGCVVDRVADICDGFRQPNQDFSLNLVRQGVSDLSVWLSKLKKMTREVYKTSEDIPEPLWRTIVGDIDQTPEGVQWPCGSQRKDQFHIYENVLKHTNHVSSLAKKPGRWAALAEAKAYTSETRHAREAFSAGLSLWGGRVFFTTENGRIGFASENVKSGDLICVFYSGPSVYLLREVPGAVALFNFVSNGYTHGLMGGEAFDLIDSGEAEERTFTII